MADWIDGTGAGSRRALFLRSQSPVAASVVVLVAIVLLLGVEVRHPGWLLTGVVLVAVATVLAIVVPWRRVRPGAHGVLPVIDLVAIGFLSVALSGVIDTVSALAAFPAIWLAFAHGARGAVIAIVGTYAASIVPLVFAPDDRSAADWASALVVPVVVSVLVVVAVILARNLRSSLAERNDAAAESERIGAVMRSFFVEVDLGLLFLDERGQPVLDNPAILEFMRLAHYRDGDEGGSRVYAEDQVTPLPPEDQPLARVRRGEDVDDFVCWVGPRGGQRALLANGRPVARPDGRPAGSVLVVQDITQALRFSRSREDALATLAHELRTPLTSIVGYAELLLMDDLPGAASARVEVITRNADQLLALTSAFLDDLHRDVELDRERVLLRDLVDDALEVMHATPGFARRNVHTDVADDLTVHADARAVSAVLTNLLSNAVKFSGEGDLITIAGGEDDTWVSLVVRNTGSRVDPADLERIFDRFYRGGNAQRAAIPGTGIGLSISRQIATAHGGTLTAEDVDDGASFKFCLPRD